MIDNRTGDFLRRLERSRLVRGAELLREEMDEDDSANTPENRRYYAAMIAALNEDKP